MNKPKTPNVKIHIGIFKLILHLSLKRTPYFEVRIYMIIKVIDIIKSLYKPSII
jgi:hypothetical protein